MKRDMILKVLDMPTADTQYKFTFPENLQKLRVKLRDTTVILRMAVETGKVATPTDPYTSIPADKEWAEDNLSNPLTRTLYFATGSINMKLEIFYWTGIDRTS